MFHFALFTSAGIFASKVTDAGEQVLSRSPFCGNPSSTYVQRIVNPVTVERDAGILQESQLSKVYAQSCYNASNDSPTYCSFQKPYLFWTKNVDSPCLFKPSICSNQTWSRSITLDSGLIDSQDDLGLNAPPGDRLSYRRVMSCAPLNNDEQYLIEGQN
jgi:hypothetical protein